MDKWENGCPRPMCGIKHIQLRILLLICNISAVSDHVIPHILSDQHLELAYCVLMDRYLHTFCP